MQFRFQKPHSGRDLVTIRLYWSVQRTLPGAGRRIGCASPPSHPSATFVRRHIARRCLRAATSHGGVCAPPQTNKSYDSSAKRFMA